MEIGRVIEEGDRKFVEIPQVAPETLPEPVPVSVPEPVPVEREEVLA
jgi:hypothetical protein